MAITGSDKIFVDVDDEINFVVEKIMAAERDRVILVVPQNAIIVSSLVSMKILAKQIAKSKKQLILITEDAFGLGLAERSGIIAINKVSNIVPEMWEAAQIAKENMRNRTDETKKKLLTERGIIEPERAPAEVAEPVSEPEAEVSDTKPQVVVEPELEVAATDAETPNAEAEMVESSAIDPEPEPEVPVVEEEARGAINRPRRDPKVVHVAGFEILAGGDIARLSATKDVMIGDSEVEQPEMDMDIEEEQRSANTADKKPTGGFTGRDWTNYTRESSGGFSLAGLNPFKRKPTPLVPGERRPLAPEPQTTRDKKKIAIIALVAVLFLFAGATYVLAFQMNTVEIKISLQTQQVPVQQAISADIALEKIDKEKLVIPAKLITNADLSISASDKASGEGKTGDKAAGVLEIWNYKLEAVTIPAGTVLQNTTTNLKYVTDVEVSVPASTAGVTPDTRNPGIKDDVHIVAETFGEEYNIEIGSSKKDFKVGNFVTAEVKGQRFNKIEGGTTKTFVSVSQENFDKVKDALTETLKKQGMNKINSSVPQGYRLIDGTQEFKETEATSDPEIGKKADNFSVSLKGTVSALAVSEADLQEAIGILITNNQKVGSEFEIKGLSDAIIGDVKRDGDKVTFTVSSSGNLSSKVTADELKTNLVGKTLEEAENYLSHIEEILSHKVTYSPGIIPESLRRIPNDPARIKIIF